MRRCLFVPLSCVGHERKREKEKEAERERERERGGRRKSERGRARVRERDGRKPREKTEWLGETSLFYVPCNETSICVSLVKTV